MLLSQGYAAIAATFVGVVTAATSVTQEQMQQWMIAGGCDLAVAYAPVWFFGQALDQAPCIPTWAYGGSPTTPDVYDVSSQSPGAALCDYPDMGCNCRIPGVPVGNPTPAFPIYYSFGQCNANEIRVAYNLYYEKDGTTLTGHAFDWERVIIVHQLGPDGRWAPSQAFLSQHAGYDKINWADIQSTLTTDEVLSGQLLLPDEVKNNDHPKVYPSWSKHANFDSRSTLFLDPLSQSLDTAFRTNDWFYFVDPQFYIRADSSTLAGQTFATVGNFGGTSIPPRVHDELCTQ